MYLYTYTMYYNKIKIKAKFENFVKAKAFSLKTSDSIFGDLNLIERIIFIDILLSHEFFKINNIEFNFDDCFREVVGISHNVINLLSERGDFFHEMHTDIVEIIKDKKTYKTKFDIGFGILDSYMYVSLLVKSIHFIENHINEDSISVEHNLLHRNIVMSNLSNYSLVFNELKKGKRLKTNCVKLMMILNKYVCKKKIRLKVKNKFKTDVYVGFTLLSPNSYKKRLVLLYGYKPFKEVREYLVSSSYLTLCEHTKRSLHQHNKNKIDVRAVIKLSSKEIDIDFSK